MLNKEVCKKCINEYRFVWGSTGDKEYYKWDKIDDACWKELGEVWCSKNGFVNYVNNYPLEKCFYILEQVVNNVK